MFFYHGPMENVENSHNVIVIRMKRILCFLFVIQILAVTCSNLNCPTCQGYECYKSRISKDKCNKGYSELPFKFQINPKKFNGRYEYGCLDLQYYTGRIAYSVKQCLPVVEGDCICEQLASYIALKKCSFHGYIRRNSRDNPYNRDSYFCNWVEYDDDDDSDSDSDDDDDSDEDVDALILEFLKEQEAVTTSTTKSSTTSKPTSTTSIKPSSTLKASTSHTPSTISTTATSKTSTTKRPTTKSTTSQKTSKTLELGSTLTKSTNSKPAYSGQQATSGETTKTTTVIKPTTKSQLADSTTMKSSASMTTTASSKATKASLAESTKSNHTTAVQNKTTNSTWSKAKSTSSMNVEEGSDQQVTRTTQVSTAITNLTTVSSFAVLKENATTTGKSTTFQNLSTAASETKMNGTEAVMLAAGASASTAGPKTLTEVATTEKQSAKELKSSLAETAAKSEMMAGSTNSTKPALISSSTESTSTDVSPINSNVTSSAHDSTVAVETSTSASKTFTSFLPEGIKTSRTSSGMSDKPGSSVSGGIGEQEATTARSVYNEPQVTPQGYVTNSTAATTTSVKPTRSTFEEEAAVNSTSTSTHSITTRGTSNELLFPQLDTISNGSTTSTASTTKAIVLNNQNIIADDTAQTKVAGTPSASKSTTIAFTGISSRATTSALVEDESAIKISINSVSTHSTTSTALDDIITTETGNFIKLLQDEEGVTVDSREDVEDKKSTQGGKTNKDIFQKTELVVSHIVTKLDDTFTSSSRTSTFTTKAENNQSVTESNSLTYGSGVTSRTKEALLGEAAGQDSSSTTTNLNQLTASTTANITDQTVDPHNTTSVASTSFAHQSAIDENGITLELFQNGSIKPESTTITSSTYQSENNDLSKLDGMSTMDLQSYGLISTGSSLPALEKNTTTGWNISTTESTAASKTKINGTRATTKSVDGDLITLSVTVIKESATKDKQSAPTSTPGPTMAQEIAETENQTVKESTTVDPVMDSGTFMASAVLPKSTDTTDVDLLEITPTESTSNKNQNQVLEDRQTSTGTSQANTAIKSASTSGLHKTSTRIPFTNKTPLENVNITEAVEPSVKEVNESIDTKSTTEITMNAEAVFQNISTSESITASEIKMNDTEATTNLDDIQKVTKLAGGEHITSVAAMGPTLTDAADVNFVEITPTESTYKSAYASTSTLTPIIPVTNRPSGVNIIESTYTVEPSLKEVFQNGSSNTESTFQNISTFESTSAPEIKIDGTEPTKLADGDHITSVAAMSSIDESAIAGPSTAHQSAKTASPSAVATIKTLSETPTTTIAPVWDSETLMDSEVLAGFDLLEITQSTSKNNQSQEDQTSTETFHASEMEQTTKLANTSTSTLTPMIPITNRIPLINITEAKYTESTAASETKMNGTDGEHITLVAAMSSTDQQGTSTAGPSSPSTAATTKTLLESSLSTTKTLSESVLAASNNNQNQPLEDRQTSSYTSNYTTTGFHVTSMMPIANLETSLASQSENNNELSNSTIEKNNQTLGLSSDGLVSTGITNFTTAESGKNTTTGTKINKSTEATTNLDGTHHLQATTLPDGDTSVNATGLIEESTADKQSPFTSTAGPSSGPVVDPVLANTTADVNLLDIPTVSISYNKENQVLDDKSNVSDGIVSTGTNLSTSAASTTDQQSASTSTTGPSTSSKLAEVAVALSGSKDTADVDLTEITPIASSNNNQNQVLEDRQTSSGTSQASEEVNITKATYTTESSDQEDVVSTSTGEAGSTSSTLSVPGQDSPSKHAIAEVDNKESNSSLVSQMLMMIIPPIMLTVLYIL